MWTNIDWQYFYCPMVDHFLPSRNFLAESGSNQISSGDDVATVETVVL
jgi:hypothetical protein